MIPIKIQMKISNASGWWIQTILSFIIIKIGLEAQI